MQSNESPCFDIGETVAFQIPESMISRTLYDGFKLDTYALGILSFTRLNDGMPPFWDSEVEIQRQLKKQHAHIEFPEIFSEGAREFLL